LRGALALALALGLPAEMPAREEIITAAFAVVAFSIFSLDPCGAQAIWKQWSLHVGSHYYLRGTTEELLLFAPAEPC